MAGIVAIRGAEIMGTRTSSALLVSMIAALALVTDAAAAIQLEFQGRRAALTAAGQHQLPGLVASRAAIDIAHPKEITDLLAAVRRCETTLHGWNKQEFLATYRERAAQLDRTATAISAGSHKFLAASGPRINPSALSYLGPPGKLPASVRKFLDDSRAREIRITTVHMQGIPGKPVSDPQVLADTGRVTTADITAALTSYIEEAAPRLYEIFAMTPSACYSETQTAFLKSQMGAFGSGKRLAVQYGTAGLRELECANGATYSRFKVPAGSLGQPVTAAIQKGPSPFGPAGAYFTRAWFLRNAVWQMYAREGGKYRDGLTADVADYYCGVP